MMRLIEHNDAEEFLHILENRFPRPWENDLMIGLVNQLIMDPLFFNSKASLYSVEDKNEIKLVSFHTPPWPIIIYADTLNEDDIFYFVDSIFNMVDSLSGINARSDLSMIFAKLWCKKLDRDMKKIMDMKLYVLQNLKNVPSCNGSFFTVNEHHYELLFEWAKCFHQEVSIGNDSEEFIRSHIDHIISTGNGFIWIDKQPVCMIFRERATDKGFSIGYVYTPKQFRKMGYASNLVYHVCKRFLEKGCSYVSLFADRKNPISNSIYKKIGFKETCNYQMLNFV